CCSGFILVFFGRSCGHFLSRNIAHFLPASTLLRMSSDERLKYETKQNANVPQINRSSVLAYSTDRYTQVYFRGGETAYVQADGDGSTTLHLEVYDKNGVLINSVS